MSDIETAEIIQLFAVRPKLGKKYSSNSAEYSRIKLDQVVADFISTRTRQDGVDEGVSDTAENHRLRQIRRDVWREADTVMDYWLASMKMNSAISRVQNFGTSEGNLHPVREPKHHWTLVANYRKAWAKLMLTPAPTAREITWKRAQLKAEKYKQTDLKAVRIERAIADDVEFLRTHPVRQSRKRDQ